jgi:hypothetical protein
MRYFLRRSFSQRASIEHGLQREALPDAERLSERKLSSVCQRVQREQNLCVSLKRLRLALIASSRVVFLRFGNVWLNQSVMWAPGGGGRGGVRRFRGG